MKRLPPMTTLALARAEHDTQDSMPSSWILRVMVLHPMPSFWAASMRRPRVISSAVWMSCASNLRVRLSQTSGTPA